MIYSHDTSCEFSQTIKDRLLPLVSFSYFHKGRTDKGCGANCTIFLRFNFLDVKILSLKFGNECISWKNPGAFELECSFRNGLNPLQCTVSNSSLTATISGWFSLAHHMSWIKMWQLICKDAFQVISVFFSNNMEFHLSCCLERTKKRKK